jgi:hypothetical protein
MMILSRDIIKAHKLSHSEFLYYEMIIEKVENNFQKNPDISIESAKALIEGISKTVLLKLDVTQTKAKVKSMDFPVLFKKACSRISSYTEFEEDFINRASSMIHILAELRNSRGDISHGREAPKDEFSSIACARMVMHTTDALVQYMLEAYFKIDLSFKNDIRYEQYPEFNEELDEVYSLGTVKYSKALFDQDPIEYEEQLKDHLDRRQSEK